MEICPKCGSRRIRFGEVWPEHIRRLFAGSRKRFCVACGLKWSAQTSKAVLERRTKTIWVVSAAVVIFLLFIFWSIWDSKTAGDMDNEAGPNVQTEVDKETPLSV